MFTLSLEPNIIVLDTAENEPDLMRKEKSWIHKLLNEKHPLVNIINFKYNEERLIKRVRDASAELEKELSSIKDKIDEIKARNNNSMAMGFSELSAMIRLRRKFAGLTQKELADLSGVGKTVVFDIENGKETIRFSTISKVLDVLSIKKMYWFE